MSPVVITTRPAHSIKQVREVMARDGVSCLPVVGDDGSLEGIITASDTLKSSEDTHPITEFISRAVFTVGPQDDAFDAAEIMLQNRVHHVVVAGLDGGNVIGIISSFDLLPLIKRST